MLELCDYSTGCSFKEVKRAYCLCSGSVRLTGREREGSRRQRFVSGNSLNRRTGTQSRLCRSVVWVVMKQGVRFLSCFPCRTEEAAVNARRRLRVCRWTKAAASEYRLSCVVNHLLESQETLNIVSHNGWVFLRSDVELACHNLS